MVYKREMLLALFGLMRAYRSRRAVARGQSAGSYHIYLSHIPVVYIYYISRSMTLRRRARPRHNLLCPGLLPSEGVYNKQQSKHRRLALRLATLKPSPCDHRNKARCGLRSNRRVLGRLRRLRPPARAEGRQHPARNKRPLLAPHSRLDW